MSDILRRQTDDAPGAWRKAIDRAVHEISSGGLNPLLPLIRHHLDAYREALWSDAYNAGLADGMERAEREE